MKKLMIIIVLLGSVFLQAQSLQGVKICIDPGHGGHDSNDRYISSTGYWESEGNLTKALKLKEYLEELGAMVILTRYENNTTDDIALSQRAAIANANNADYFHSIHSNAFNAKSNYTLVLFNGTDNNPTFDAAKSMGQIMSQEIYKTNRTTAAYNRSDRDFLGFNLGVLKTLTMPGTLSEGSFHDYIPESFRLKNTEYCYHEALAIQKAFLKYFEAGASTKGSIAGIIRNPLETVPSSYNVSSTSNDKFVAINEIRVVIPELNKEYVGDYNNSGFYYFDNVEPGEYTLVISADNFANDTATITVVGNETVFYDSMLDEKPNLNSPSITKIFPNDNSTNVSNITDIIIDFDMKMDQISTEAGFKIEPSTKGDFYWERGDKQLIFRPSQSYIQNTEYKISISDSVKSFYGKCIKNGTSFQFTTRDKINLISNYPLHNSENISSTVVMKFVFDSPIKSSSLSGNIAFTDIEGNNVSVKVNTQKYDDGIIEFEPRYPLEKGQTYRISINGGISDNEYVKLVDNILVEYKVENDFFSEGVIVTSFEDVTDWQDPFNSPKTKNLNLINSQFDVSSIKKISGEKSLYVKYEFTDSNGVLDLSLKNKLEIPTSNYNKFGIWIFGDNSNNIINLSFNNHDNEEIIISADSLDWSGWKLVEINLDNMNYDSGIYFNGISIVQNLPEGKSGNVYFDAAQVDYLTPVEEINNLPYNFEVEQNYPNPFNPSTTIEFMVPYTKDGSIQKTKIIIYNVIGEIIKTLVDDYFEAGKHKITFDASNLSSGIYFAKLTNGINSKTIKMILVK